MRHNGLVGVGAILLIVGLLGLASVLVLGRTAMMSGPLLSTNTFRGEAASFGERIYLTGAGESGTIRRSGGIGRMGSGGCITCHGPDGQGGSIGMMGSFAEAPPITYGVLTGAHGEHDSGDEAEEAWTDADIARAVRDGVTPDERRLDPIMPRWDMNDEDMDALIDYLKTLGEE